MMGEHWYTIGNVQKGQTLVIVDGKPAEQESWAQVYLWVGVWD
jgi:hypothetical protein